MLAGRPWSDTARLEALAFGFPLHGGITPFGEHLLSGEVDIYVSVMLIYASVAFQ